MRVLCNGVGRKPIKSATKGARPSPLIQLAVGVEVGPAILAPRQGLAVRSHRRRVSVLIPAGERRHGDPPN